MLPFATRRSPHGQDHHAGNTDIGAFVSQRERDGLGRDVSVEDDTALVIDFGAHRVRVTTPCAKLTKL